MTSPADLPAPAPVAVGSTTEWFCPARMMDVELTEPLPSVPDCRQRQRVWVLGRLHTEPVGICDIQLSQKGLTPGELGTLLWREFRGLVTDRFAAAGLPRPSALTGDGLETDPTAWPLLRQREAVLAAAPFISAVICTRNRPERVRTWLRFISRQEYPCYEVVVVDNAPTGDAVRTAVEEANGPRFRYVREPRPGLSWARNAGIAAASGEIIAFFDDDGEPDRHWLAGLACGFTRGDDIGCVTGAVLPAKLDTVAQEVAEQLGGFCKGRGFSSAVFSRHGPQSPLYPVPPFGSGANMAFRREALARIGGFDVALGAGTPAQGGEDTLALTMVLLAGYRIAYEPAAVMRHDHRRDLDSLRRQAHGHGVGLTAYYAALLRCRPNVLPALIRLAPTGVSYIRTANYRRTTAPLDLLTDVKRQYRRSMAIGPMAYVKSVCRQARVAGAEVYQMRASDDRCQPGFQGSPSS
jgi:glycosyltransferase involved in cell wall biosynthesis